MDMADEFNDAALANPDMDAAKTQASVLQLSLRGEGKPQEAQGHEPVLSQFSQGVEEGWTTIKAQLLPEQSKTAELQRQLEACMTFV